MDINSPPVPFELRVQGATIAAKRDARAGETAIILTIPSSVTNRQPSCRSELYPPRFDSYISCLSHRISIDAFKHRQKRKLEIDRPVPRG